MGYSENTVYQFGTRGILNPAKAKLDTYDELTGAYQDKSKIIESRDKCPVTLEHVRLVISETLNAANKENKEKT